MFITTFTIARHLNQLDPVHTLTSYFMKIHLNIIFPAMPGSFKWSLSLRFSHQNPAYASPLNACCMPRPSHSWFNHPNNFIKLWHQNLDLEPQFAYWGVLISLWHYICKTSQPCLHTFPDFRNYGHNTCRFEWMALIPDMISIFRLSHI